MSRAAAGPTSDALPEALRACLEFLPVGVVMATADGAIVLANAALERMLAYTRAELIGQSIDLLVADVQRAAERREVFARHKDGSELQVDLQLTPVRLDARAFIVVSMWDVNDRRRGEAALRKSLDERIDFESLVGDLAAQFVNLRADAVDRTIEEALGRLVRALDLDRSALFQIVDDTGDFVHTHQCTRPGCAPVPERVSASDQFPWILSKMLSGEPVMFAALGEIPGDVDRESYRRLGTQSAVVMPLMIRGRAWGALTFASVAAPRAWQPELLNRLRVVALLFANVLARKQSDERLRRAMNGQAHQRARLRDENAYLRHELNSALGASALVGNSAGMRRVLEQAGQVASSDATVLLTGETGTGKSLLAARIHDLSSRREHAMVRVNCAALSAAAVERELFGRERSSSLGNDARQVGLLELANESTLFFDEVADLAPDTQARLVRVLQSREIQPAGTGRSIEANFRVIAATRRDLASAVKDGSFRDDLYYCLNVLSIQVPPLRKRVDDIPLLVWRFVDEFSIAYGKVIDTIDAPSMARLQRHSWPGNARELRNVVERAMIVSTGRQLRIPLPASAKFRPAPRSAK